MGCDIRIILLTFASTNISIHAPTWGATLWSTRLQLHGDISIHAPTWGATMRRTRKITGGEFQSTHPRGVRQTHKTMDKILFNFNPRTHVGCDGHEAQGHQPDGFQSTHPRGVRPMMIGIVIVEYNFNPRTHVGCDYMVRKIVYRLRLFQSTHPRGVRHSREHRLVEMTRFQSTHPRGVRLRQTRSSGEYMVISIHAPTWGATRTVVFGINSSVNFNPRTHVGCDLVRSTL